MFPVGKREQEKKSWKELWQRGKEKEHGNGKMGEENAKCAVIAFTNSSDC